MSGELNLPENALGTVRADPSGGALAIRCMWESDEEPTWVVVNIAEDGSGFTEMPDIASWPVVFSAAAPVSSPVKQP
jgi:hypothetical protein